MGGIPEIFGPHAHELLPAGDAEKLATAMQRVLDDYHSAEKLAASLHHYVYSHFRFSTMVEHVVGFYSELTTRPSNDTVAQRNQIVVQIKS